MKFKNCFIDEKGNIWKAESLIKSAKNLPIFKYDISKVDLDTIIRWKLVNLRDYLNHFQRVCDADASKPIILRADGYIMNGWHRVIQALHEGLLYLPAKQFTVNPEPDFKP
ncbi:MAG: hypothetical protein ABIC68_07085 [Candidatus Omnitrophota bacterium]